MNIDANDIIDNLLSEVAKYVRENAILKAQIKNLNDQITELKDSVDINSN